MEKIKGGAVASAACCAECCRGAGRDFGDGIKMRSEFCYGKFVAGSSGAGEA